MKKRRKVEKGGKEGTKEEKKEESKERRNKKRHRNENREQNAVKIKIIGSKKIVFQKWNTTEGMKICKVKEIFTYF